MGELTVVRWRRFGKDRLYVTTADGKNAGHVDLQTGDTVVELPELADAFHRAVAGWRAAEQGAPEPRSGLDDYFVVAEAKRDLARNRPGQAARERAVEERREAPVRTTLARVLGVHTDERAWRIGADGEEKVAAQLDKLEKHGWRAVHAVPVGTRGSDIDHVVVGPGGVYTINTKHHPQARIWVRGEQFQVNGRRQPYIRNSRFEARRAAQLLSTACGFPVPVTGLIVVVNAGGVNVRDLPPDVQVTNRMNLRRWLGGRPVTLEPAAVDAIYRAARTSSTWTP